MLRIWRESRPDARGQPALSTSSPTRRSRKEETTGKPKPPPKKDTTTLQNGKTDRQFKVILEATCCGGQNVPEPDPYAPKKHSSEPRPAIGFRLKRCLKRSQEDFTCIILVNLSIGVSMPQPLSSIKHDATFTLATNALVGRPELADLVTQIIGVWSVIEQELETLFCRIFESNEPVSAAIYSAIPNQRTKMDALKAGVNSKFSNDIEKIENIYAVLDLVDRVKEIRHRLAHWRWGYSIDIPGALLLADPSSTKLTRISQTLVRKIDFSYDDSTRIFTDKILKNIGFDTSKIFVYFQSELNSELENLVQANFALSLLDLYINPQMTSERAAELKSHLDTQFHHSIDIGTSEWALSQLSGLILFEQARYRLDLKNNRIPKNTM